MTDVVPYKCAEIVSGVCAPKSGEKGAPNKEGANAGSDCAFGWQTQAYTDVDTKIPDDAEVFIQVRFGIHFTSLSSVGFLRQFHA